jgi:hypothetical protein
MPAFLATFITCVVLTSLYAFFNSINRRGCYWILVVIFCSVVVAPIVWQSRPQAKGGFAVALTIFALIVLIMRWLFRPPRADST